MTLIMPLLVMLVFGMIETGMAWRNVITVTSGARQGARVTSHLGTNPQSDQEGILAVQAVMGADIDQVTLIVIYNANGDGLVPTPCLGSSFDTAQVQCNRYTPEMIADAADDSKWGCAGGTYDATWCPEARDGDTRTADHIGVYIEFKHDYFTGVIPGDGPTIERHTVMRIEPEVD